ncbi:MAG: sodium:proton antiporter [Acidobacteria bacterium]|nr:MAG: sodium:proton antiporter [Acidobacteriota bacterium]
MDELGFAVVALAILAFGLVSARAQRGLLTPPMAFVLFGFAVGPGGFDLLHLEVDGAAVHLLAEITLVLVLFADATRIDVKLLRREHDLPLRLLAVGMPLTIVAGTAAGLVFLPGLSFWEAALLAAILAPTDAALGQAVVANDKVPARIRQALNVESGLNDGIALPVVLVLFSVACASAGQESIPYWLGFAALQLTVGPLAGVLVGLAGGRLVDAASSRGWMTETFQELAAIALALLAFATAELAHGNGFIAAFCAGLVLGNTARAVCTLERFADAEGQLLTLLVFLIFGADLVPQALAHANWPTVAYAVVILTAARMVPVALSLLGKGLQPATVLFLGWFGPRGLASILFALLVIEAPGGAQHEALIPIVMLTVLISVLAHGITASPLAERYARRLAGRDMPEHAPVSELPLRPRRPGGRR